MKASSGGSNADPFAEINEILAEFFYKPDIQALRIVMGTMMAQYLDIGDPPWLFVVAPPGSGKTTMSIMGAAGLPLVQTISDITENTLLSGFHGHQQPGLLEKLPVEQVEKTYTTTGNGILLIKDFTTVLSMRREKRAAILAQLREVHDGQFSRHFGTGVTKIWRGKLTVIAAVTPVLDRHYSIFSTLGERFVQVRWHRPDSEIAGEIALAQQGQEEKIRSRLAAAINQLVRMALKVAPTLSDEMRRRIASLAEIVARGRTHVFRNNYGSREIEYVPEPEANTRIAKQLGAIARGIAALNRHSVVTESEFQDIVRVGLDCLPENRRRLVTAAMNGQDVTEVHMAETVLRREIEEMEALGIIGRGFFTLTPELQRLLRAAKIDFAQPISSFEETSVAVPHLLSSKTA